MILAGTYDRDMRYPRFCGSTGANDRHGDAGAKACSKASAGFACWSKGVTDYAIYMLDPDGIVTNWNAGAERIKGYAADEIVGQHFSRFYTPEDRAAGLPPRALETPRREGRYRSRRLARAQGRHAVSGRSVVIDAIHDRRRC